MSKKKPVDSIKGLAPCADDIAPPAISLFIEPAPYITRLDEELKRLWPARVVSCYISKSVSQKWEDTSVRGERCFLPRSFLGAIKALWLEMRSLRPRVVFVAGWSHPIVIVAILMARLLGAKVISFSDTWRSDSSWFRHWTKLGVLQFIDGFTPGGRRQTQYLLNLGIPARYVFPANMTVDTDWIRMFIQAEGGDRRVLIRNSLNLAKETPVFLFVGRLEPVKGVDLLLEAFTLLPAEHPVCLVIVGDGSMRAIVEQAAAKDARIVFRGRLEGPELLAQFAAADVLVAPSRKEPWGLVVNEALTAGLPVVLTDCFGCIDDLLRPNKNGIIIRGGDIEALRETLFRLVQEPGLRASLQENVSQSTEGWTSQAWAANILSAWRAVLYSDRNVP